MLCILMFVIISVGRPMYILFLKFFYMQLLCHVIVFFPVFNTLLNPLNSSGNCVS
jgi:hypothetical protein